MRSLVDKILYAFQLNFNAGILRRKGACVQRLGMGCDFVARRDSEEGLVMVVAAHGKDMHGILEITPELAAKAKPISRDE